MTQPQAGLLGEPFAVADREGSATSPQQGRRIAPLAITCGDPAGIGPELIERILGAQSLDIGDAPVGASSFSERASEQAVTAAGKLAVIGPRQWLERLPDFVEKVAVGDSAFRAQAGVPSEAGARLALEAMECAAAGCVSGRFAGVVTGPVSKAELAKVGYPFPGQTEFFAARWGGEQCERAGGQAVMGFVGERLRVVLATWHVPLAEVRRVLTEERLTCAVAAAADLGGRGARIAVCGLNPHAGEGGLLGVEERDFLNPILEKLSARYAGLVPQCLPGDTVFARALRGEFDVVVALYHDQGLAPLKAVDFDTAVNVTLGLPFVRTSPDHGTAFDLAGKGTASPRSFANAIRLARNLLR